MPVDARGKHTRLLSDYFQVRTHALQGRHKQHLTLCRVCVCVPPSLYNGKPATILPENGLWRSYGFGMVRVVLRACTDCITSSPVAAEQVCMYMSDFVRVGEFKKHALDVPSRGCVPAQRRVAAYC